MTATLDTTSTLRVLARQEVRGYLRAKLFWFSAILMLLVTVLMLVGRFGSSGESSVEYMIAPAALLGLLGLVTMFGLARRSDRAAEAAGAVALPERTRTLALACAVVVPFGTALVAYAGAVVGYYAHPPAHYVIPPGVSDAYVLAVQFGAGVLCAVGGPLLGLLLARYLPRRGVSAIAAVVLVLVTILLQGNFQGGQPYRVFWVWTSFLGPFGWGPSADGLNHFQTAPGNPFFWLLYLVTLCALGVVAAVFHDAESDRPTLRKVAVGLAAVAVVLGVASMTVGYQDVAVNPVPCRSC